MFILRCLLSKPVVLNLFGAVAFFRYKDRSEIKLTNFLLLIFFGRNFYLAKTSPIFELLEEIKTQLFLIKLLLSIYSISEILYKQTFLPKKEVLKILST